MNAPGLTLSAHEASRVSSARAFPYVQGSQAELSPLGWWHRGDAELRRGDAALREALLNVRKSFLLIADDGGFSVTRKDLRESCAHGEDTLAVAAYVPPSHPELLGDAAFMEFLGIRYPCIAGSMAHGISSVEMVESMAAAGMLGFFGAGGETAAKVEQAIDRLSVAPGTRPFGFNFIHSPGEPAMEEALADLYLRRGIRLIEASAFMDITPALVRYRAAGLSEGPDGSITVANRIIAKASRAEVATRFFSPPPQAVLEELVSSGRISEKQKALAAVIPLADALTAEADSGGHTDNRPLVTLLPAMCALRDELQKKFGYRQKLHVGAAGGISTPASAAAAFTMGAAYIMTGSVNQSCIESGTSEAVRDLLSKTRQADITMAPSADMFELGVKIQAIKTGTMFPMRAAKLYQLYQTCASLEEIPPKERETIEKNFFRASFQEVWNQTCEYFLERDPGQIDLAGQNARHKMALLFRYYLGQSARWAILGEPSRQLDYQIWCGPSMGAFNEWVKGSPLEHVKRRKVALVALNLLHGAAVAMRLAHLRSQGIDLFQVGSPRPLEEEQLANYLS
ncbi:MAG: PfaD family polyunsaturated fatty acid/polyketide biosynthesis protein [Candidatus Eremiobacteraeota bacterium]|nr:PfaD family polyunsaturated fatty acid/polyketide biosynthesis protein [Candidatus Eremiobacteraeota bacterium]